MGGAIVTASGLTFVGATDDARFRAFDTKTGKELWTVKLPASAESTPITYADAKGQQYIAVVATGGFGDRCCAGRATLWWSSAYRVRAPDTLTESLPKPQSAAPAANDCRLCAFRTELICRQDRGMI